MVDLEQNRGGSMGSNILIKVDGKYIGHFYPENLEDVDTLREIIDAYNETKRIIFELTPIDKDE